MGHRKILITGAAGRMGGYLGRNWQDRYLMRLADIREIDYEVSSEHEVRRVDITNLGEMRTACEGIDTVVHLAADANRQADFYESLLDLNVIGMYNAFQAAADRGCRRIVFASSVNAVNGYPPEVTVTEELPVNPRFVYGACKVMGEALGRTFLHQYGLSAFCIRFGGIWDNDRASDPSQPGQYITKRDAAQLIGCCIEVEGLEYAVLHGFSKHVHCQYSIERTCQLVGYEPRDGTYFVKGK